MKILFNDEKQIRKILLISISVFIIAILAFTIFFVIYSDVVEKELKIAEIKSSITDLGKSENTAPVSTSIGKTIQQVVIEDEGENKKEEVVNKIAINTSNMVKANEVKEEEKEQETEQEEEEEILQDPEFEKPVEGEIIKEFAKEDLVYSNTLGEWVTHLGIDIKAPKTSVVKSAEAGTIKSIKNDPRYGITVVIEHVNGYSSVYANLLTAEFVKEGEKVNKGQTIGTVGNTGAFEIADEPHLHFEILKDGENIDPNVF
ncbi:MAG: M23 family metallopeptidase [Clostridia bacterium]|nr:M23 family metallopeptidase [Clostridia bacterium]